jgi:aryl-alcohol dehydrogenase-like predicted oxidoreductase
MQDRRAFLRRLMTLTAGLSLASPLRRAHAAPAPAGAPESSGGGGPRYVEPIERDRLGPLLPQRRLGRTGEFVTIMGFGGSHYIHEGQSQRQSQALIEAALEEGIRFIDTAQQYGNGESERRMGQQLVPKYRDLVYLMTKTQARDANHARRDMDGCRKRLNVDVIDLMQIHHIESEAEVDKLVDNGVVDVLLEAREQGKIRHLGFTGHDTPKAHLRMLDRLRQRGIEFDTVQMPINIVDPSYESFIENVLPTLVERDYGVLAMKTLAFGRLMGQAKGWRRRGRGPGRAVVPELVSLSEALGFVWSLPVSTLISGTPSIEMLRENAGLARSFRPLDEKQREAMIERVAEFGGVDTEFYKA